MPCARDRRVLQAFQCRARIGLERLERRYRSQAIVCGHQLCHALHPLAGVAPELLQSTTLLLGRLLQSRAQGGLGMRDALEMADIGKR